MEIPTALVSSVLFLQLVDRWGYLCWPGQPESSGKAGACSGGLYDQDQAKLLLLSAKIVTNPRSVCQEQAITQTWSRAAHALRANVRRQHCLRQGEEGCWLFYCHSVSEMPHMLKPLPSSDFVMIPKRKSKDQWKRNFLFWKQLPVTTKVENVIIEL